MSHSLDLLTYLTGEPATGVRSPQVGDTVELRLLPGGLSLQAFSAAGECLGRVPPADRDALADFRPANHGPLRGWISALVPRPGLPGAGRIHIRVSGA